MQKVGNLNWPDVTHALVVPVAVVVVVVFGDVVGMKDGPGIKIITTENKLYLTYV